jgi:hypothetical protein
VKSVCAVAALDRAGVLPSILTEWPNSKRQSPDKLVDPQ